MATADSEALGRGARRRQLAREKRQERQALAWWSQPGVLIFLLALGLAAVGWMLVFRASQKITVRQATLGGLTVELDQARWILDQMDHGENFQKPSVMMPDMPEWGKQRMTLDLTFHNETRETQIFDGEEFFLVPDIGDGVPPMGAQVGRAKLAPGQSFNTALHFDFDTREPHGQLRVAWNRGGETAYLPVPEPAEHYHLRPKGGEVALPPKASMVAPLGKVARGGDLYMGMYGCVACHGDPEIPDSNNVGPHLAGIGSAAETRVEGMRGDQYLYESIIEPDAHIAPECRGGIPCATPTAMPEYASLMPLQDLADVLAYLLDQQGGAPPVVDGPEGAPPSEEVGSDDGGVGP